MCAFDRLSYFTDLAFGARACTQLLETAARWAVEVIAYCFMPDHLHCLIEGKTATANSRKFAGVFRQVSGFHFEGERSLWQEGYFDHVLRQEDDTGAVVKYIVLNPVRAGLCADPRDYPLLGSSRFELSELMTAADWYPPSLG